MSAERFEYGDRVVSKETRLKGVCKNNEHGQRNSKEGVWIVRVLWDDEAEYDVPITAIEFSQTNDEVETFPAFLRRIASSDLAMSRDEYREAASRIDDVLALIDTWEYNCERENENAPNGLSRIRGLLTVRDYDSVAL